jgi:hypothetical protein
MPPPSYPNVNGNKHSWASIVLLINTTRIKGFKGINYKNTMEPGEVRGEGVQIIGRTRGELKSEGSLELYLEEYHQLIEALSADGTGYLEKSFEITVSYSEAGSAIITDRLIGCRVKGGDKGFSPGTDGLSVKCDLSIMFILENGKSPISDPQGVS